MQANPYKLDKTIKDFLVTYGLKSEELYHINVRVFVTTLAERSIEKARKYILEQDLNVEWGTIDQELGEAMNRWWWNRNRKLKAHIPYSHMPESGNWLKWFDLSMSFAQIAALSLEDWVQEIRTVSISVDLLKYSILAMVAGVIARKSI